MKFVVGVWESLLEKEWANAKHYIVFSDGCGRQWKFTKFSIYLLLLSVRIKKVVDYNFFPSNHGQGICDVVGAQGQRTINTVEVNTKAEIRAPSQLAEILSKTKNHEGRVAPPPIDPLPISITTRDGIKSWHRMHYENGVMTAWRASTDEKMGIPADAELVEGATKSSLIFTPASCHSRRKNRDKKKKLPHADTRNLRPLATEPQATPQRKERYRPENDPRLASFFLVGRQTCNPLTPL